MIYADIVKQALRDLAPGNLAARRRLYDQLKNGLQSALEESEPPVDGRDKVIELRLLETTVRRFEADLRAGLDVTADAYVPQGLDAEQARLYALKVIARAPVSAGMTAPTDEYREYTAALSCQMQELSFGAAPEGFRESLFRPAVLGALLLRFVTEMAWSQGRLGLLWILFEPILLVGSTVAVYLMFDQRSVMNMDVVPFAVMGVVAWMLIRVTAIRIASSALSRRDLLALPPIRIISIVIGEASAQFIVYTLAMLGGLCLGIAFGHGEGPDNWVSFAIIWTILWIFGVATGLSLSLVFSMWKAAPRFLLLGTRFLASTSGLFFVSEQFPSDFKSYILWNPLVHGMQLLRSAYFAQYKTEDGSLFYFLLSIGVILIMAAASERVLAPRVEPA